MYEASERVPLIVAGPGIPAGRVVTNLPSLLDVFPTLVALARGQVRGRAAYLWRLVRLSSLLSDAPPPHASRARPRAVVQRRLRSMARACNRRGTACNRHASPLPRELPAYLNGSSLAAFWQTTTGSPPRKDYVAAQYNSNMGNTGSFMLRQVVQCNAM